jgi:hypothetical protein
MDAVEAVSDDSGYTEVLDYDSTDAEGADEDIHSSTASAEELDHVSDTSMLFPTASAELMDDCISNAPATLGTTTTSQTTTMNQILRLNMRVTMANSILLTRFQLLQQPRQSTRTLAIMTPKMKQIWPCID